MPRLSSSRTVPIVGRILVLLALVTAACSGASDALGEDTSDSQGQTDEVVEAGPPSIGLIMPVAGELEFSPAVKLSDQPFYDIIDLGLDCDTPSEPSNAIANETYLAAAHEGAVWINDVVHGFQFDTVAEATSYFDELAEPMQSCDIAGSNYESMERSSSTGPVQWVRIDPVPEESRRSQAIGYPVSVLHAGAFVVAVVDWPEPLRTASDEFAHTELTDQLANNLELVADNRLALRKPADLSADPLALLHTLMLNSYDNAGGGYFAPFAVADVRATDLPGCPATVRPRGTESFDAIGYANNLTISGSGSASSARPDWLDITIVDVGADGDAQAFIDKLTAWRTECSSQSGNWSPAERQTVTPASGSDIEIVTLTDTSSGSLSIIVTIVDGTHGLEISALHGVDDQEFADLFVERRDFAIDALVNRPDR